MNAGSFPAGLQRWVWDYGREEGLRGHQCGEQKQQGSEGRMKTIRYMYMQAVEAQMIVMLLASRRTFSLMVRPER